MLLEAFVGMEVVLELKTDAQVLGYVEWADGGMKCVPPHSLCAADDRADFGGVANWPARQWSECRLHARMCVCKIAGRGVSVLLVLTIASACLSRAGNAGDPGSHFHQGQAHSLCSYP